MIAILFFNYYTPLVSLYPLTCISMKSIIIAFLISSTGALYALECPSKQTLSIDFGICQRQGQRHYMEDIVGVPQIARNNTLLYAGLFDGHNGARAAQHCAYFFSRHLSQLLEKGHSTKQAMEQAYATLERECCEKYDAGTTAVTATVENQSLIFSWVGDSEGFLVRDGDVILKTRPHNLDNPVEYKRALSKNGQIITYTDEQGYYMRLNGLAMSRALGDQCSKSLSPGAISAEPEFTQAVDLQIGDTFVLMSDRVTDNGLSQAQLAPLISKCITTHQVPDVHAPYCPNELYYHAGDPFLFSLAQCLVNSAYKGGSTDNISVVLGHCFASPSIMFRTPSTTTRQALTIRESCSGSPTSTPSLNSQENQWRTTSL